MIMDPNRDYYGILGLNKNATLNEVKKAFRKLAIQYHPDKNPDKGAQVKFQEINEAHEVLSDTESRQQYDVAREFASQRDPHVTFYGSESERRNATFESFLRGSDVHARRMMKSQLRVHLQYPISWVDAIKGAEISFYYNQKQADNSVLNVKKSMRVHAGIRSGEEFTFPNEGGRSILHGKIVMGDLIVRIKCPALPHGMTQDEHGNIHYNAVIPYYSLILGADIQVPLLEGNSAKVNVKRLSDPNVQLRLKGKGLPISDSTRTDMYVHLEPSFPNVEHQEEMMMLEKISALFATKAN